MPFDPNKPFNVLDSKPSGFDPNRPYKQVEVDEEVDVPQDVNETKVYKEPIGRAESYLRGTAQGLTSDFADNIAAKVLAKLRGTSAETELAEQRRQFKSAQEQNPVSYGAGQFTGGAMQGIATAALPLGMPARFAAATALGGLQGYGASDADTFSEAMPDIKQGAAMGMLGGGFGEALPIMSKGAQSFAVNRSAAALGAERGTIKSMGPKKIKEAGEMALQQKTFGPLTQTAGMQTNNKAMLKRAWGGMEDVFNQLDSTGKAFFSPWEAAVNFEKKAGRFDRRLPINQSKVRTYERNLDSILQKGGANGENISFADAMSLKSDLDDLANWKSRDKITVQEQMARDAYHAVNEAIDSAVEKASQELGNTALGKQLIDNRKMYAAGKTAEKLLENRYAREQGNKMGTGLTNTIIGGPAIGASLATGDPKYMGIIAAKIAYEKAGQQTMARGANFISNILKGSPQLLGKYAPTMLSAMQNGGQSLAVKHYIMSQKDPEYVETVRQAIEESEKKKIELPKYGGLGADIGNVIDSSTWSDRIGLDPQERDESGFQYGEGVPQPASIKPFSFKRVFPSKSGLGSEVKSLMPLTGGEITSPADRQIIRKIQMQREKTSLDPNMAKFEVMNEGAVFPKDNGVPDFSFSRSPQGVKHEHIHNQIEGLNRIDSQASRAMDNHFREKAKSFGVDVDHIVKKMHGPKEFMSVIGDILEEEPRRRAYFGKDNEWSRSQIQSLRRFYTEAAKEAQNMSVDDVKRITDHYKNTNVSNILSRFGIKEK